MRKKEYIKSFNEFVNESMVSVKRKYTDNHPEIKLSNIAPVRHKILSFVKEHGTISEHELKEYLKGLNEERGSNATPSSWIRKNLRYFNVSEDNKGIKHYSLNKFGRRVESKIDISEGGDFEDEDFEDEDCECADGCNCDENEILEKSESKTQQRLMGQAYALKNGDIEESDLNPEFKDEIKELADSMTLKQLKDFAETKHEGLPEKK